MGLIDEHEIPRLKSLCLGLFLGIYFTHLWVKFNKPRTFEIKEFLKR